MLVLHIFEVDSSDTIPAVSLKYVVDTKLYQNSLLILLRLRRNQFIYQPLRFTDEIFIHDLFGSGTEKDLKIIPYLAQFIDAIFSLCFNDLAQIKSLTDAANQTPYSDYCSDKWTLTLTPGYKPAPEDVTPPNPPDTLLLLDYGKNLLKPEHTPAKEQEDKENH